MIARAAAVEKAMPAKADELKELLEEELAAQIEALPSSRVSHAMGYSLLAGGKRMRPMFLFAVLEAYRKDPRIALPMACAIEMTHTYSLIHDDMPEMDDDTLRRGRPCNHIVYGADIALLAGDGLQTLAYENAARTEEPKIAVKLCALLAKKAGPAGMVYGQDLDLAASKTTTLAELEAIERYKTGCLFELPLMAGAILAGADEDLDTWSSIGEAIGVLFQIQDDLLEMEASEEQMGKSLSDSKNEKATALSLYGLAEGKKRVSELFDTIDAALETLNIDRKPIDALLDAMKHRDH